MRLLLDTHVWYWALESPRKLGKVCSRALEDPRNELVVSTVSTLELGQLAHSGRIVFKGALDSWVRRGIELMETATVSLTHQIAARAYQLPGDFHKDPADRMLVATAIEHGLTLVTADARILAYPHAMTVDARR